MKKYASDTKKAKKNKTDFAAIKKLLKYARPYVPVIIIALVLSALQIAATLLAPVVVGKTVDYIIGENKPGPVGQALYHAMMDIQQGRTPDKFGWVTHVKQD